MCDLIKFLRQHSDTEYVSGEIRAYQGEDIIDTYHNANNGIEVVLERMHKGHTGQECVNELHDGFYERAFEAIKEDI